MKGTKLGLQNQPGNWWVQSMAPPVQTWMPRAAMESSFRKKIIPFGSSHNIADPGDNFAIFWLETCGSHSLVNGCASVGLDVGIKTSIGTPLRAPDAVTCFLNDPGNYPALQQVRPGVDPNQYMGNEIPQWIAYAGQALFGAKTNFLWLHDFAKVADIVSSGVAVEFGLKSPLHFLVAVAYDEATNELIYVDPAPYRSPSDWWQRRMNETEYNATVDLFSITISA